MEKSNESVTFVIIASSRVLMATELHLDTAVKVLSLVSDDPSSWDEALSGWARYRTPAVCEFADEVTLEVISYDEATMGLAAADPWVPIESNTCHPLI